MESIKLNFSKTNGKIKHMNSVNNGPVAKSVREFDNFDDYKAAKIPYARIHDASFYPSYGGEFTVDVHRIFRSFDNDVNDPKSYSFKSTDKYLQSIVDAGTKVFYRLGCNIEHYEKCGTIPPKDNQKWAEICEHIVRHYTEGWADGFYYDIEYWEIWNEADCKNADGTSPCWQGTEDEFVEFFVTAFKHLKNAFPKLKIGGPAFAYLPESYPFAERLFDRLNKEDLKLDFFSYHAYATDTDWFLYMVNFAADLAKRCGQGQAELILNEWNYVKGWRGKEWQYTLKTEKGLKGASFIAAIMCAGQKAQLDMLMYYDARPCGMNGMFNTDTFEKLKGYYPIAYFSKLLELGKYVEDISSSKDLCVCSATNGTDSAILLTHYNDNDETEQKTVKLDLSGLGEKSSVEIFVLDENNDMSLCKSFGINGDSADFTLDIPLFTTYFISIKNSN